MLVISCYVNQTIKIGDSIVVKMIGYDERRGHFKLGIEAPAGVRILRGELEPYEAKATREGQP